MLQVMLHTSRRCLEVEQREDTSSLVIDDEFEVDVDGQQDAAELDERVMTILEWEIYDAVHNVHMDDPLQQFEQQEDENVADSYSDRVSGRLYIPIQL